MTTFERTYRELERLKGVSLHKETLLYKVEPERTEEKTKPSRGILIGMAWCALFWIALGLIVWMVR